MGDEEGREGDDVPSQPPRFTPRTRGSKEKARIATTSSRTSLIPGMDLLSGPVARESGSGEFEW